MCVVEGRGQAAVDTAMRKDIFEYFMSDKNHFG